MTLSPEVREEIIKLRKAGYIYAAITRKLGVSRCSVSRICKDAGIPKPPPGKQLGRKLGSGRYKRVFSPSPFQDRNDEMRELRRQGLTLREIGDKYGITEERARQLCVGIERPDLRIRRNCGTCGVEFIPFSRELGSSRKKYCSIACGRKAISDANRSPESKWSKHGTVKLTCSGCGVDFERTNYIASMLVHNRQLRGAKDSGLRFCTSECYWEHRGDLWDQLKEDK